LSDTLASLQKINPDVFVEFRQKYTGPAMRKYGNMFRAFDCPGDSVMNRVRIADIKMLSGNTSVHSDMITWHPDEPIEIAALQLINTLFGVPQLSITLQEASDEELSMISFFTKYWNTHKDVFCHGNFTPSNPLANYPIQQIKKDKYTIIGIHDEFVLNLNESNSNIHIINAKITDTIALKCEEDFGKYEATVFNCKGELVYKDSISLTKGIMPFKVPACGIVQLKKTN